MTREDPTHLSHSNPSTLVSVTLPKTRPLKSRGKIDVSWGGGKTIRFCKVKGCGSTYVSWVCGKCEFKQVQVLYKFVHVETRPQHLLDT